MLVQVCCESAKFRAACIMEMSVKHENYITDGHSSYIFSTAKSCVYGWTSQLPTVTYEPLPFF